MSLSKFGTLRMGHDQLHAESGKRASVPRLAGTDRSLEMRSKPHTTQTRQLRVKTGCMTCRRRKKKCDETKPRCMGCRRNDLFCIWPAPKEVAASTNISSDEDELTSHKRFLPRTLLFDRADPSLPRLMSSPVSAKCGASAMTKESSLFLRHYMSETGVIFAVQQANKNPYLTHLLPLACSDDLLMHSLLAIGGTHMASRMPSSGELERSSLMHYLAMIEGVRMEVGRVDEDDFDATVRLLLVLILLSHYQIMEGSSDGKFYEHLKACKKLIEKLFAIDPNPAQVPSDYTDMLGFSLELYAYMMVSNYLSPYGTLVGRSLQLDTTLLSHDHLSQYKTFGTMFSTLYGLYQFIPEVARFAMHRLDEEASGMIGPSEESHRTYKELKSNIASWSPALPKFDSDIREWREQNETAEIIRRGLYIYLLTSMAGSLVSDFETIEVIQTYSETMLKKMLGLIHSQYQTLFMWPGVICGSCLIDPKRQQDLVRGIKSSPCSAKHVHTACEAMEMLWADPDPRSFGPYGLYRLKEKHGFWTPML